MTDRVILHYTKLVYWLKRKNEKKKTSIGKILLLKILIKRTEDYRQSFKNRRDCQ